MTTLRRVGLAAWGLLALSTAPLHAQQGCEFGERGNRVVDSQTLPGIGRVTYVSRPHFVCDGGSVEIFADSAVAYGDRGMSHLMGSVRYLEEGRELRAEEARYFTNEGRLQAQRRVRVIDEIQGSSIENGDLVYLLQTDFRPEATMTVTVGADGLRPRAILTPPPDTAAAADNAAAAADSATAGDSARVGEPPVPDPGTASRPSTPVAPRPYTVDANRIFLRGSAYFTASGDVAIERDSLFAYADSAEYDPAGPLLSLVGSARVEGATYELTGRTITMNDPGGDASEVQAVREARLTGEDVLLTSARILVVLRDGALNRLVATPVTRGGEAVADSADLERPEALVEDFVLTADSLELTAPAERMQRVFASGGARSVSHARDSLNAEVLPDIARADWLEGDTVIIRFVGSDSVPPLAGPTTTVISADSASSASDSTTTATDSTATAADSTATAADPTMNPTDPRVAAADSAVGADTVQIGADPVSELLEELVPPLEPPTVGADPDENVVEEIIARVRARSLYRLPPNDSTFRAGVDAPAVHYVTGTEIRILLDDGEVMEMRVTGQTRGVHLEPLRRGARPDSAAVLDTVGVRIDTLAIPDTGRAIPDTGRAAVDTTGNQPPPPVVRSGTRSRPPPYQPLEDPRPGDGPPRPSEEHPWKPR